MDEVQYLNWKADIISEYRHEALGLWTMLGIILYGYFGGFEAFFRPKTLVFFLLGFLAGSYLVSRINYAIIKAFARRRGKYLASLVGTGKYEKTLTWDRLVIRFLQISVNLTATLLTFVMVELLF